VPIDAEEGAIDLAFKPWSGHSWSFKQNAGIPRFARNDDF